MQATTSSCVTCKTTDGVVDREQVKTIKAQIDAPPVQYISINQTQEYFAVATKVGFEIIQNDSSSDRIKKKVQLLSDSVYLIEMMYKTNFIVLVMESARHKVIIWDDYERKNRTEISFNS